ncbi:peptidoglycan-binding domain-containing protein [Hyalangium gracile]|uniref:peptidoglycan-binding domain-containing protein n=1 Tax=Hyalangium gracile TaxID=394092 RepID=UPI001CCA3761|nr:peptidoglycan-binding domain-containing protein [Hyalangium gracile]
MPPETAPTTTTGNPFSLVAYLLFQVRHSLEDPGDLGRPPRWIRIARARNATGPQDYIALGVREAINGFAEALSYMVELTMDIQEILVQTDAAKALVEVTADFIKAATSDNFVKGVQTVVGISVTDAQNPLSGVGGIMDRIKEYLGYIPDPDDVYVLGHELYRLLCIEQEMLPRLANGTVDEAKIPASTLHHVNVEKSGKIRLLQWAFNQDLTVYGLGDKTHPEEEKLAISRYGSRRLWRTDNAKLPARVLETWSGSGGSPETIIEWFFDGRETTEANRTLDIAETFGLLEKMGYTEPTVAQKTAFGAELAKRLRRFQAINELPISGELDNATLNRLMHLDYSAKNILRAKPFDATRLPADIDPMDEPTAPRSTGGFLRIVNPGAEAPQEEGITPVAHARYPYYKAGAALPAVGPAPVQPGGGWISDAGGDAIPGFVALRSRYLRPGPNRYEGGRWSEGEAASGGQYFFAARFTEPWVPGRTGKPQNSIFTASPDWADGKPPAGSVTRMYQWIPLNTLDRKAGWDLFITASVMRRSLYEERSQTTGQPDRGTIAVEFYGDDVFKGPGTPRPRVRTSEAADLVSATRKADPWPQSADTTARLSDDEVSQKRYWVKQSVENVLVPPGATAMLVILEGHYTAGWDIDAYFDDVQVTYTFRKK